MVRLDLDIWIEAERTLTRHLGLGFAYVLLVEQKLTVKVAHVDRIQVNLKAISNNIYFLSIHAKLNGKYLYLLE